MDYYYETPKIYTIYRNVSDDKQIIEVDLIKNNLVVQFRSFGISGLSWVQTDRNSDYEENDFLLPSLRDTD